MNLIDRWEWTQHKPWKEDEKTDTEYKIEVIDGIIYIGFRGTTTFKDWLYNAFALPFPPFIKKPYKNMPKLWFVHAGFFLKWKAVKEAVLNELEALMVKGNIRGIVLMGHSQGGGIATVAYEDIWFKYPAYRPLLSAELFASPRVFWLIGSKTLFSRFENAKRYEYFYDIVPHLPPKLFLGFFHVGRKIKVGKPWYHVDVRFISNHMKYERHLDTLR